LQSVTRSGTCDDWPFAFKFHKGILSGVYEKPWRGGRIERGGVSPRTIPSSLLRIVAPQGRQKITAESPECLSPLRGSDPGKVAESASWG
jgi:hypothetical protein